MESACQYSKQSFVRNKGTKVNKTEIYRQSFCNQPFTGKQINPVVKWSIDIFRLPNITLNFRRIIKGLSDYCPHGRCNLENILSDYCLIIVLMEDAI